MGRYMKPDSGYIEIDTEAALLVGLSTTRACRSCWMKEWLSPVTLRQRSD